MPDANLWAKAKQTLQYANRVLLLCHDHADADAINSVASFGMWLLGLGVDFRFAYFAELPDTLFLLDSSFDLRAHVETNPEAIAADVIVVLDTGAIHLLGEAGQFLSHGLPVICIDHHKSNDLFGDINIVETSAAAACELLFDLFHDSPVEISPNMAHSLLAGMLGDTHNLSTSHVTPATLRKAADLIDLGAHRNRIIEGMPLIASIPTAKVWARLLDSIQLAGKNNEIAYCVATQQMIADSGLTYIKNISSFIRNIGGVDVAVLFLEEANQQVKVEFRSKSHIDVGKIAEALGGGGHRGASGCPIENMSMDEAIKVTLQTVINHVEEQGSQRQ